MSSTEFCPECGRRAPQHDRFCRSCGTPLSDHVVDEPIAEAEALASTGQLDHAIATIQRAIGTNETPELHVALSTLHLRRGNSIEARRDLERALSLDSRCAVAHAYVGGMELHAGRLAESQARLDLARDLRPDDLIVRIKRAEFWLRLGIFDNAKAELRHALQNGGGSRQNRAIAETMFASIEKRSRGSFTRKTVALPAFAAIKHAFRRRPSRVASASELEV